MATKAAAVRERPILFSGEMVKAILAGRKTVTRRVIKPQPRRVEAGDLMLVGDVTVHQPAGWEWKDSYWREESSPVPSLVWENPYGQPGDRLWVRETWRRPNVNADTPVAEGQSVVYRATSNFHDGFGEPWRSSIFMRRWMSRIVLEVVDVRAERLRAITEDEAEAEGFHREGCGGQGNVLTFKTLWDKLNAARGFGWEKNPFVWRVEFRVLSPTL